jgi:Cft2 family RNA processing exonuclease
MASPGFMQSGVSRQLFEQWCDSDKNGVIIAGERVYLIVAQFYQNINSLLLLIVCDSIIFIGPFKLFNITYHH